MAKEIMYSLLAIKRELEIDGRQCQCNSCMGNSDDDDEEEETYDAEELKRQERIAKRLALRYLTELELRGDWCKFNSTDKARLRKIALTGRMHVLEAEIKALHLGVDVPAGVSDREWTTDDESEDDDYDDDDLNNIGDLGDRHYKSVDAYNYEKREETIVVSTSKEKAWESAQRLIESEEMAKKKAEKKKAKKKRQKEKKKSKMTEEDSRERKSTLTSATSSESIASNQPLKCKGQQVKRGKEAAKASDSDEPITEEGDFLDTNAAFVKVAVKQNNKHNVKKVAVDPPEKPPATRKAKFVTAVENKVVVETPHSPCIQGYQFAANNNFIDAINCFSKAITMNPMDIRHYVNRSYCYLRLGQYTSALADAQFVLKNSRVFGELARAACRAGKAYFEMQDYAQAEKFFEESLSYSPGNLRVYRELLRVRITQLTSMGFSERNAIRALQQCPTVIDAVNLLTSEDIYTTENAGDEEFYGNKDCDIDDIYWSDTEESSSNVHQLTKLVSNTKYVPKPNSSKDLDLQNLVTMSQLNGFNDMTSIAFNNLRNDVPNNNAKNSFVLNKNHKPPQHISHTINGTLSNGAIKKIPMNNGNAKTIIANSKPQPEKIVINDKAIWIGNITDKITDGRLRQEFSKFGEIVTIHRLPLKFCVFINYTSSIAASQAITNMNDVEINGIKISVNKARKTEKPKQ